MIIEMSKFPFKTQKTTPNGSDNKSTWLLLQAWLIRQTMAWVYTYTTLWLNVLRKIENIVREEMNAIWCYETSMPNLSPKELWETTNRWDIDVLFHVPAANDKEYALNCTQEELVTPLMKEFIQSYKDLPVCAYQIQYKFRNEKRAKSWILRWREFIMKDAYSFHASDEEFRQYYDIMAKAYMKVFERLGLWKDTFMAMADGWVFTDKYSHEFQVKLEIWEDKIYRDPVSGKCYNLEVTPAKVWKENISDEILQEKQDILVEWIIWVEALEKHLGIPKHKTTKTMMFETEDSRFIVASVRWDYDINTLKLQKIIWCKSLNLASEERVLKETGASIGYAWIINLPEKVELFLDDSVKNLTNFETGTNKTGYHSINVNFWRDVELPEKFYDFKEAKLWDKNPETWEVYEVFNASEIGNIFPLETKFSKAFWLTYLDENNETKTPLMWCYGLWVTRSMWIVAEYYASEKGILWPKNLAPADYYVIVLWEDNLDKARELCISLSNSWKTVIFDDRMSKKVGFGQKAWDSELLGIPTRIVISPKTLELWGYEILERGKEARIEKF